MESGGTAVQEGKYLTFSLTGEEYGISIRKVKEIIVDSVSEVLNIRGGDVEPAPDFGLDADTRYILGMAKSGSGVKILLDIDRVLCSVDLAGQNENLSVH